MRHNLTQSVILASSLLVVLTTLSSCGKSKDVKSVAPTAVIAQSTPPPLQTPLPQTLPTAPSAQTPAQPGTLPTVLPPLPSATSTPMNQLPPITQTGPEVLPPLPALPAFDPNANLTSVLNPPLKPVTKEDQKAYQLNFAGQAAVKTGGQSNDLFYTSVGDDRLMEEFKSYGGKVSLEQQLMNVNLAKAIVNAKLTRTQTSGQVSLKLTMDEFGEIKNYHLTAASEGESMKLSLSPEGTTGDLNFQGGFLKCLDADGLCEVAYAKIKFDGGYTRIIFRNSMADMHFLLQDKITGNLGFDLWKKYILNAANAINTTERVDGMQIFSFEIINGRAGAGALLMMGDHQALALSIPMVVSAQNSEVSASVTKMNDLSKNYDLISAANPTSSSLSQKVNQVMLVNNNGRGQFKLQLQLGTGAAPASVWVVVARVQKEILSVEKIRTFESKLKPF